MNMEEKLELKHAAPYLPYGVRVTKEGWGKTFRMDIDGTTLNCVGIDYVLHKQAKLLLHPLSRLTEPIKWKGCEYMSFHEIMNGTDLYCDAYQEWWDCQYPDYEKMMQNCPMELFSILLELHFDVFSLIPQGLAIPIEPQPIKTK